MDKPKSDSELLLEHLMNQPSDEEFEAELEALLNQPGISREQVAALILTKTQKKAN